MRRFDRPVSRLLVALGVALALAAACGSGDNNEASPTQPRSAPPTGAPTKASGDLILATTTSTQDSGLLDVLVPRFEDESGYNVKVIAVGSGQAIAQAARGDADVVLVHSPAAERKMVADGDGIERTLVMHNDFIIVGPEDDPASVAGSASAGDAMRAIFDGSGPFISRGDDSGTHALEKSLWAKVSLDPSGQSWYEESGQGMGATLQIANQKREYTISDRGTFLALKDHLDLKVLFAGDPTLYNVYHVIVVNPAKHANVNVTGARAFAAFMVRQDTQNQIGTFGVEDFGQPLFYPDAGKPDPTE
jgi:tungstate transport system substrate-binding protein